MTSFRVFVLATILALVRTVSVAQGPGLGAAPKSVVPKDGFVPTADVAVTIAEAVLVPVYGKQLINSERPFKAELSHDVWDVNGTVPCNPPGSLCPGGAAEVKISKKTGQILFMTHDQ
ncbi:MAG TPA: NTF2 fold immunity protein [Bryobacteraceae bacterium]|nr:NTF2 fold immunity protein [Bryobacteraceae bacterium]